MTDGADIAVRALTTKQREDLFRFARSVLPNGHPLKGRIEELAVRTSQRLGQIVDDVLTAEIHKTAIDAWREVEALKDAGGRESGRTTEEYRRSRVARLDHFLAQGLIAENEILDLKKAFGDAHQDHPDLSVWAYRNESSRPSGPGALQFIELANRAASALAGARGDGTWRFWLDALVGYLLTNDRDEEYIQKFTAGGRDRPPGSTSETHREVLVEGETYKIRQAFKVSELCCSWLARVVRRKQADNATTQAAIVSPAPAPLRGLKAASRSSLRPREWEDIKIEFVSDERVQITVGAQTETRNYEEMGFGNKKNGKPVSAWEVLRIMASNQGGIELASDSRKWAEVEKRIQEIRKSLRSLFNLTDDPLPYIKKTRQNSQDFGYRAKFRIGCRPSYES